MVFTYAPVVRDFGIVTALTVIFSLTMALILLPLLLVYQAQSKQKETIYKNDEISIHCSLPTNKSAIQRVIGCTRFSSSELDVEFHVPLIQIL